MSSRSRPGNQSERNVVTEDFIPLQSNFSDDSVIFIEDTNETCAKTEKSHDVNVSNEQQCSIIEIVDDSLCDELPLNNNKDEKEPDKMTAALQSCSIIEVTDCSTLTNEKRKRKLSITSNSEEPSSKKTNTCKDIILIDASDDEETRLKKSLCNNRRKMKRKELKAKCQKQKFAQKKNNFINPVISNKQENVKNVSDSDSASLNNCNINRVYGNNLINGGVVKKTGLRPIIIDGSNVAMGHSNGKFFSIKGLQICINYFLQRGHKVKAFVPQFRTKSGQSSDPKLLRWLCDQGYVILTPSREINGKRIVSYDDRFIVQSAAELDGVIVSSDNYRDLIVENSELSPVIEKRLLIPTWLDDILIFPSDPLGKHGPNLDTFLRFP